MRGATQRREELKAVWEQGRDCTRCGLHVSRTTVVFGSGDADADLMFIGEAPGANEDRQGVPFVGQAGKLLDRMLEEIGLERGDVFIANTLMCRPPGNRDPHPHEIEACSGYLHRKVELIEPRVICTLGNFATKLLRGDPTGISRLHGQAQELTLGRRAVRLYPLYHPAAALYTPSMLETLRADFARIPDLLTLDLPPQPEPLDAELAGRDDLDDREDPKDPEPGLDVEPAPDRADGDEDLSPDDAADPERIVQLGLF